MTIADELREYINRWTCLTGHPPSAMPVTQDERHQLYVELCDLGLYFTDTLGRVPQFIGVDLYITDDAKERREQIIARKP